MVTVSADDFQSLTHLTDSNISAADTEKVLDSAIEALNLFGKLEISALHGAAGSKTLSVEGKVRFAIYLVARAIYYGFYKDVTPAAVSGMSVNPLDLMSNATVLESLKQASENLRETDWSRAII